MATDKYSTITQHQPLRVPETWTGQERRFVAQLEELLDDIYRRFGRLKLSDLGTGLRTEITETAEKISFVATGTDDEGNPCVEELHNSSLDITGDGVDMKSTGHINIVAGGALNIEAGGKGNIDLTQGGGTVAATSGKFDSLICGGDVVGVNAFHMPVRAYVTHGASALPEDAVKPCLWINEATGGGDEDISSITNLASQWAISKSYAGTRSITTPKVAADKSTYTYTLGFSLRNTAGSELKMYNVYARVKGSVLVDGVYTAIQEVFTLGPVGTIKGYETKALKKTISSNNKLFNGRDLEMDMYYDADGFGYIRVPTTVPITLTCEGAGSGTQEGSCTVTWVS